MVYPSQQDTTPCKFNNNLSDGNFTNHKYMPGKVMKTENLEMELVYKTLIC